MKTIYVLIMTYNSEIAYLCLCDIETRQIVDCLIALLTVRKKRIVCTCVILKTTDKYKEIE